MCASVLRRSNLVSRTNFYLKSPFRLDPYRSFPRRTFICNQTTEKKQETSASHRHAHSTNDFASQEKPFSDYNDKKAATDDAKEKSTDANSTRKHDSYVVHLKLPKTKCTSFIIDKSKAYYKFVNKHWNLDGNFLCLAFTSLGGIAGGALAFIIGCNLYDFDYNMWFQFPMLFANMGLHLILVAAGAFLVGATAYALPYYWWIAVPIALNDARTRYLKNNKNSDDNSE